MNGWLTENGTFYEVPIGKHYKYLIETLKFSKDKANNIPAKWIIIRDWNSNFDSVYYKRHLKYRFKYFSDTDRKKYTIAQLEFLQKHNCLIDTTKI